MRQSEQNRNSYCLNKAEHIILLWLFFSIPIFPKVTTFLIILFAVIRLVNYKQINFINLRFHKSFSALILIYLILIIGLLYTNDLGSGLEKIQTQLSFLIIPLFLGTKTLSKEDINKYLCMFIFGVLITILLCLGYGGYRFFSNGSIYVLDEFSRSHNVFYYIEFSRIIDLHPTYFSIYISVAFYALIELPKKFILNNLKLKWGVAVLLLFALVLTSSKGGIFSFAISSVVYMIYVFKTRKRKYFLKVFSLVSVGLIAAFLINPMLYKRSKQFLVSLEKVWIKKGQSNESTAIRFGLWKLSAEVSKEAMFVGYGTGSVYKTLNDNCIYLFSFSICESLRNKNCHNQYLNFLVSNGVLIVLPFLFIIATTILKAFRNKDGFLLFFIVFMGLNFMFESLLQRERGVVFFTMFLILLLVTDKTKQKKWEIQKI